LPISATFVGDQSLSRRPMRRVAKPLEAMGARFDLPEHGGLPMTVHGGTLHDVVWTTEQASAQSKSAIRRAAGVSGVRARVTEPISTRDSAERMLEARGVPVRVSGTTVSVEPGVVRPLDVDVPGDPSSAAFFAGLAAIANRGTLRLEGVGVNETRMGFFR